MIKVGIIGFGGIGHVHASQYPRNPHVQLVAVADICPEKLEARSMQINLGPSGTCDLSGVRTYPSGDELLAREKLDIIDICLPTDLHSEYAIKAMHAGSHVLSEKPMARTIEQADAMLAAARATGRKLMIAQCVRFTPAYELLREACRNGDFGRLLAFSMRRVSPPPGWGGAGSWFLDGKRSGGALIDMHIHDTDFANWMLGVPSSVITSGARFRSGAIDNSTTLYFYDGGPVVTGETSWGYAASFHYGFCAIFEQATIETGYRSADVVLTRVGAATETLKLSDRSQYGAEIDYFIDCVRTDREPEKCTGFSARETLRIALAEERSAAAGGERVRL